MDLIDEFSPVCLAILVGLPCQAVDVLDTIEELLKQQRELVNLRMDNGPELIAHALKEWCTGMVRNRHTPRQDHLGKTLCGVV